MAESIIIHFLEPDRAKIVGLIEERCGPQTSGTWTFPKDDCLLLIRAYGDLDWEYEEPELEEVRAKLGGPPSSSFDFEIRRSRSDEACDVLEKFVKKDLKGFNFVVDVMDGCLFWSELEEAGGFLDCYRYRKRNALVPDQTSQGQSDDGV